MNPSIEPALAGPGAAAAGGSRGRRGNRGRGRRVLLVELLFLSVELFQKIGAVGGEALARQRLGLLQTEQGHLDDALVTLEAGATLAKQALLRSHVQVRLYASIAHNRLLANDLPAAEQALAMGQQLVKEHGRCSL